MTLKIAPKHQKEKKKPHTPKKNPKKHGQKEALRSGERRLNNWPWVYKLQKKLESMMLAEKRGSTPVGSEPATDIQPL